MMTETPTDAAERHATRLIETEWTAAHRLAAQLTKAQRHLLECSLIAAHGLGSTWEYNRKENAS